MVGGYCELCSKHRARIVLYIPFVDVQICNRCYDAKIANCKLCCRDLFLFVKHLAAVGYLVDQKHDDLTQMKTQASPRKLRELDTLALFEVYHPKNRKNFMNLHHDVLCKWKLVFGHDMFHYWKTVFNAHVVEYHKACHISFCHEEDCKLILHPSDNKCSQCLRGRCKLHSTLSLTACRSCKRAVCSDCVTICCECYKPHCENDATPCAKCLDVYCVRCSDSLRCDLCFDTMCFHCQPTTNSEFGLFICYDCDKTYTQSKIVRNITNVDDDNEDRDVGPNPHFNWANANHETALLFLNIAHTHQNHNVPK